LWAKMVRIDRGGTKRTIKRFQGGIVTRELCDSSFKLIREKKKGEKRGKGTDKSRKNGH